jgi:hypothetical protein
MRVSALPLPCSDLHRYVYERLTPPGGKPTFMTLMVTQLVSGVWHGLYPGYIMFFAGGCGWWVGLAWCLCQGSRHAMQTALTAAAPPPADSSLFPAS